MILDKIVKISDNALENYIIVSKGKLKRFEFKDKPRLVAFLNNLTKKIDATIVKKDAEVEALNAALEKDSSEAERKSRASVTGTIFGISIFLFSTIALLTFGYAIPHYLLASYLGVGVMGLFSSVAGIMVTDSLKKNPKIEELEKQEDELLREKKLIEKLINHLQFRRGQKKEEDIFSIASEPVPSFFRKIGLRLWGKPHSFKENSFYQSVNSKRLDRIGTKLDANKKRQKTLPADVRKAMGLKSAVQQIFNSRKKTATDCAEEAYEQYESSRLKVVKAYAKKDKFFESRVFDDALDCSDNVDIKALDTIIKREMALNGSTKELLEYSEALKTCLRTNSNLNMYETDEIRVKRAIRLQLWYLRQLLRRHKKLESKASKAYKKTNGCYVRTFKP